MKMNRHLLWIVPLALLSLVVLGFLLRNIIQGRDLKNIELMENEKSSSMEDDLKKSKHKVVYFFAEWCGHCRNLAPIWDDFVKKAKIEVSDVDFFKINVDKEKALSEAYGVKSLPDVRFISDNEETRFSGERTVEGLMEALKKMAPKQE
jgi:thiol-disulfide isomerase/thioredoxin